MPKSASQLERMLEAGQFAVIAELKPPDSADLSAFIEEALILRGMCDTIALTDNPMANVHVANIAPGALLVGRGFDVMCSMTSRDRNRIGQQGYLLALAALGITNIFCPTGDHPRYGDHPDATAVYETNSLKMIALARKMRDAGTYDSGRRLESPPRVFIGGTAAPDSPPIADRPQDALRKVEAGADFLMSQPILDITAFKQYMARLRDLGVTERAHFIAGIAPVPSLEMAEALRNTPDIAIVDAMMDRLRRTPEGRRDEEGLQIGVEIVEEVRAIAGVHGVLIYPLGCPPERMVRLIERAELRRVPTAQG